MSLEWEIEVAKQVLIHIYVLVPIMTAFLHLLIVKYMVFEDIQILFQILFQTLTSCVVRSNLLSLSEPSFFHLQGWHLMGLL